MSLNLEEYVDKLQSELSSLQSQTESLNLQIQEQSIIFNENLAKIPEQVRSSQVNLEAPLDIHLEISELEIDPVMIDQTLLDMYKINTK